MVEINAAQLRLGNASKDFSVDNMKKTRLYRYVYDFSVDYDIIIIIIIIVVIIIIIIIIIIITIIGHH